jgi:mRNA interferase MazF
MKRGEVWWAQLPGADRHPVLVLSRDISIEVRNSVTVAEITGTIRGIPSEVELDKSDGMGKQCCVNLDNILTLPKDLLSNPLTSLSPERMSEVEEAIVFALDLSSGKGPSSFRDLWSHL